MGVKLRNPDGTLRGATPARREEIVLDDADVAALTPLLQVKINESVSPSDRGDFTVSHEEGQWRIRPASGEWPDDLRRPEAWIDMTDWANNILVRDYVERRRKAARLAEFRATILAVRKDMTDDEFVAWCGDVIPLFLA